MVHKNPVIRRHVTDNVFALVAHMMRFAGSLQSLGAIEITLDYPAPNETIRNTMTQLYGCQPLYSAKQASVTLGNDILSTPLNVNGPEQLRITEELAKRQLTEQQHNNDWLSLVKRKSGI